MLMMSHVRAWWERIRASFWFVPALMALLGVLFAEVVLALDQRIPNVFLVNSWLIISAGPTEQRALLLGLAAAGLSAESDRQALRQRVVAVEGLLGDSWPLRSPERSETSAMSLDR